MIKEEEMKDTEASLDEISRRVEEHATRKHVPLFECFVTLFSILVSIMIMQFPHVLQLEVVGANDEHIAVFQMLLALAPAWVYGVLFFIAGTFKGVGLLVSKNYLRVVGLLLSVALYATFTLNLMFNAPSFLLICFFTMTLFSVISLPLIKNTGISLKEEKAGIEVLEILEMDNKEL